MVKVNLELNNRLRQSHFATSIDNQKLNKNRLKRLFHQLNEHLLSYGLSFKKIQLVETAQDERRPEFELEISENQTHHRSLEFDCQFLREMMNMSKKNYQLFERILSNHLNGIPKLGASDSAKFQINDLFSLESNQLGVYIQDPVTKIRFMLANFLKNNQYTEKRIKIKFSGDSTRISKTGLQILNVTFSLINDKENCMNEKGHYLLGSFQIESEDYENVKSATDDVLNELRTLNQIDIHGNRYDLIKYISGDMKFLAIMYGLGASNSTYSCIWCEEFNSTSIVDPEKKYKITRSLNKALQKFHLKEMSKRVGYQKEPIISFIDFDHCVIDVLHLHLRISDQLLTLLVSILNENDPGTSSSLEERPNLKKYLDFLQNDCKITKPFYFKKIDNETTIKVRNLSGKERNKIFEEMYHEQNMIDLFPNLENRLENLNFIFYEYYSLLSLIKKFGQLRTPIDLGALEMRLKRWLDFYITEQPKITPYIHAFVFHMIDFLIINPDLSSFNMQGLEKLNDFTKKYYFSQTNRKKTKYIRQLVEKRNRYEYFESLMKEDF